MLKKMLATTALSALLVAPALAQDTVQPDEPIEAPAQMDDAPETTTPETDPLGAPMEEPEADMPEFGEPEAADPAPEADPLQGEDTGMPATDPIFAEDVIGADLVDFDGESIATVDDAVLDASGNVEALLVDVGGFLGFGARTVAISIDDVTMETDLDGNVVLRTALTADDLENLPEYEEEPEAEM